YGNEADPDHGDVYVPYRFAGREYDPESGLYYNRSRYYAPSLGRFLSLDSIGIWGDLGNYGNGYAYVGNMGNVRRDPEGRYPFIVHAVFWVYSNLLQETQMYAWQATTGQDLRGGKLAGIGRMASDAIYNYQQNILTRVQDAVSSDKHGMNRNKEWSERIYIQGTAVDGAQQLIPIERTFIKTRYQDKDGNWYTVAIVVDIDASNGQQLSYLKIIMSEKDNKIKEACMTTTGKCDLPSYPGAMPDPDSDEPKDVKMLLRTGMLKPKTKEKDRDIEEYPFDKIPLRKWFWLRPKEKKILGSDDGRMYLRRDLHVPYDDPYKWLNVNNPGFVDPMPPDWSRTN
ncbi:MAG: RHS repeat-associated core domain-containing protein, partial [Deltaproteobacteria bacterium]|nr:RHS repeat-associated core domain-containing protein [Deltaproteobacteria bacterium]